MFRRKKRAESVVSQKQQDNFNIGYKLLNRVNEIGWIASTLNVALYTLNPLNASQFVMESADLGMTRAVGSTAELDRTGQHIKASKRRELIYYGHAGVASANLPITYFTWNNQGDLSPRSLGLSFTVGALSLTGLYLDTKKQETSTDNNSHKRNNIAVRYINKTNFIEAAAGIAGAVGYRFYEHSPAIATLATGVAVGALMIKGAQEEHEFRMSNLT